MVLLEGSYERGIPVVTPDTDQTTRKLTVDFAQVMSDVVPLILTFAAGPTLNPQPSTLNHSLNPQPSTLNPQPSTINTQPSTLNPQPSTYNPQPSTLHLQPSFLNSQPTTLNLQPGCKDRPRRGSRGGMRCSAGPEHAPPAPALAIQYPVLILEPEPW